MTKSIYGLIATLLVFLQTNAQAGKPASFIAFQLQFGDAPLELNRTYVSDTRDTLQLAGFKCYISGIECHYTDGTVNKETDSYHLLDAARKATLLVGVNVDKTKQIKQLVFNIGIDSTASVSGAMSGALDPVNGMYWAWQSGYINMKIEGKSPNCKTRKNEFNFHIGGYQAPYYAMRKIVLDYSGDADRIPVVIDLKRFFKTLSLSQTNSIMIPGAKAMQLADQSTEMFYLE